MKAIAASLRGTKQRRPTPTPGLTTCLACGATIESALSRLGSLRCHDCRDTTARLDPPRVHDWWRGRLWHHAPRRPT
jgi:hypothetical protein